MSEAKRVYLGLGLDEVVAERVARETADALGDVGPIALYAPDDLHVTLAFLGELGPEALARLRTAADGEFAGISAPELTVEGRGGAFPSADQPRAVWRAVSEALGTEGRLAVLHNRALQAGFAAGWRPGRAERERPFQPHVTVARPSAGTHVPDDCLRSLGRARSWLPVEVTLFVSSAPEARERGEARYGRLGSWNLAVRPD